MFSNKQCNYIINPNHVYNNSIKRGKAFPLPSKLRFSGHPLQAGTPRNAPNKEAVGVANSRHPNGLNNAPPENNPGRANSAVNNPAAGESPPDY